MDFDTIESLEDLTTLMQRASSDDGEGLRFELKGSQGESKFKTPIKKLLSKEICAFANTYGGILCFHYGGDTNIEKFPVSVVSQNFNAIEGWLRDCLEPKLMGIDVRIVDGVYLIKIPESETKPHRAGNHAQYFYRHSTISQTMPEIMISSMYRSQDYLSYSSSVGIGKINSRQLMISIKIINHSNVAGTKPKVQIQLFGKLNNGLKFQDNINFQQNPNSTFMFPELVRKLNIPYVGIFDTKSTFSENILYPQDSLKISCLSQANEELGELKFLLVGMDCMLKQSVRQTEYKIIEFENNSSKVYMSTKDFTMSEVIRKFKQLIG